MRIGGAPGTPSDDKAKGGDDETLARKQVNDAAAYIRGLAQMRGRIKDMRAQLHGALHERFGERRDFGFLLTQRGMFSYTGISEPQVHRLRDEHGVYLIRSGRMCMSGLSTKNVDYVANAMAQVL